jgi:thiol-disulfide isomerase/thioredoxin
LKSSGFMDTSIIENGVFFFEGEVQQPRLCRIEYEGSGTYREFYLENSIISFHGNVDSLEKSIVSGSKHEEDRIAYSLLMSRFDKKYAELELQYEDADEQKEAQLDKQYEEIEMDQVEVQKQFIKQNPSSYLCIGILNEIDWSFNSAAELNEYVSVLDTTKIKSKEIEYFKNLVKRMKSVEIGSIAPDFIMNDVNGTPVRLSEIYQKNELLLLDFWASTCGPCRKENVNIRRAYLKYHQKGFDVLGVSTDTKEKMWLKAINDDALIWTNVCNLKKWGDNEIVSTYALRQVSQNFLIDNTGKIIAKDLKGDDLIIRLEELLKTSE